MPITSTIQPNMGFSFLPSIFFDIAIPMKIPITESAANIPRNFQSVSIIFIELAKPSKEFMAMINNDVATALFMGKPSNMTKAGTIKNPPPAPINPVIIPTKSPCEIKIVY